MSEHPEQRPGVVCDAAADGVLAHIPGSASTTWLNRTATLIFELCTGVNDASAIARAMQHAFDLSEPPDAAVRDTIADLVAAGLIWPGLASSAPTERVVLMIALWATSGSVAAHTLDEMHEIVTGAERLGIDVALTIDESRSMRTARNHAASIAVREATATHVLFLDASAEAIGAVRAADLAALIASQHEVVGIPVPVGEPMWERARDAALAGLSTSEVAHLAQGYDIALPAGIDVAQIERGFLVGKHCSSGAMLVQRTALERIAGSGFVTRNAGSLVMGALSNAGGWGFFDPGMSHQGIDLDEDISFCERVRASGGQVMIDVSGGFGEHLHAAERMRTRR